MRDLNRGDLGEGTVVSTALSQTNMLIPTKRLETYGLIHLQINSTRKSYAHNEKGNFMQLVREISGNFATQ